MVEVGVKDKKEQCLYCLADGCLVDDGLFEAGWPRYE